MEEKTNEELKIEKNQKSRNRIFGFLLIIALALLAILIYEIICFVK